MEKKIQALGWFHASGEMFAVSIWPDSGYQQYAELCKENECFADRCTVKEVTITWEE